MIHPDLREALRINFVNPTVCGRLPEIFAAAIVKVLL